MIIDEKAEAIRANFPLQMQADGVKQRLSKAAYLKNLEGVIQSNREGAPDLTDGEFASLIAWRDMIAANYLISKSITAAAIELEKAQTAISAAPIGEWGGLIEARNQAQAKFDDCREKASFTSTAMHQFGEYFRDYVPKSILLAKQNEVQTVSN